MPSGMWDSRDEPKWRKPDTLLTLTQQVGASNLSDIQAAFSLGFTVFDNLHHFRNFYAHRNMFTEKEVQRIALQYSISPQLRPSAILLSKPIGQYQPLLINWIDEVIQTVIFLCV